MSDLAPQRPDVDPLAELLASLSPEEAARLATMRADLHGCGYVDTDEHGRLRPGVRVYHRGHQWPGASDGTGTALVLTEKPDSGWSRSWGAADIELIVLWDKAQFGSRLSQVAQYHVYAVEVLPETGGTT
ncbi:hypothetical protein OOJ91_12905 [Micromonospora lupini]|uniref:hypothetical protein n=1 Tax=Micromonospora lupini TaxID=285679 RepID=UPI0022576996|nr:hypothetical protein [Micromonospora lupini]MCX5066746.1 hypothetical protein [Micromonospora lupini]